MATVSIEKDYELKDDKRLKNYINNSKNQKPYKKKSNIKINIDEIVR